MTLELCASTRDWIARSPSRQELLDFAAWLESERYSAFVCDQHLRRLAFIVPRLAPRGRPGRYSERRLKTVFGAECECPSRLLRFSGTHRVYKRYLLARGRLHPEVVHDRFALLRGDYARRGFSVSSRQHHAKEVADFLRRGLRPRQQLRSLSRTDVEHFIQIRSREISRPLWPTTARLVSGLITEAATSSVDPANRLLFTNARGGPLTRYGVRYLLRRYVQRATRAAPTLRGKRLHPHSVRHSTAVALLKAGVDIATISQWLGHAGLNTTMRYARADLDLKRQALSQVFPDALAPPRGGRLLMDGSNLVGWLRRM